MLSRIDGKGIPLPWGRGNTLPIYTDLTHVSNQIKMSLKLMKLFVIDAQSDSSSNKSICDMCIFINKPIFQNLKLEIALAISAQPVEIFLKFKAGNCVSNYSFK